MAIDELATLTTTYEGNDVAFNGMLQAELNRLGSSGTMGAGHGLEAGHDHVRIHTICSDVRDLPDNSRTTFRRLLAVLQRDYVAEDREVYDEEMGAIMQVFADDAAAVAGNRVALYGRHSPPPQIRPHRCRAARWAPPSAAMTARECFGTAWDLFA